MSISSALHNAMAGLTVTSRSADIVSSNIANAATEGYGVRRLETASMLTSGDGAGVRVAGVSRQADLVLIGQRRDADAALAHSNLAAGFHGQIEALIGTPDDPSSLSARRDAFEASLVSAANRPDSQSRLTAVHDDAMRLAEKFNQISEGVQATRLTADEKINDAVDMLNTTLRQISDLNADIRANQGGGRDISALLDHQQRLIDQISPLIPLRERRDSSGMVTLYSADGISVVDGVAAEFSFTPTPVIDADMTLENGGLERLYVDGRPVTLSGTQASLAGGELQALFAQRDEWSVTAQSRLDAVARDLVSRFDAASLDPSISATDAGLFTDAGSRFDPANEVGFSANIRVNAAISPDQGGAVWRLRDGLGATSEGPPGDPTFLNGLLAALQQDQPTQSGGFSTAVRSFYDLTTDFLSLHGLARQSAETDQGFAASRHASLKEAELAKGVDTDQEMQRLLLIEQAFAANAKMIQAAEDMLDQLMRI